MKALKICVVVVLLAGSVFLWRACRPVSYVNLPPPAKGGWVAFGDSLTAGTGASAGNDYPSLLSDRFGFSIRNMGVPGNTTRDGLARSHEVVALEPKVVLLCLGGNDTLQGMPAEQTFGNLSTLVDQFHAAGSFVVLIGVRSASFRDKNAGRFKALAREKRVFYVEDILDGVMGSPALMSDYIHPNDAGYRKIAGRLGDELTPLLPQLRP